MKHMTPQEYGQYLYNKFYGIPLYIKTVKQCCHIAVDAQISLYNELNQLGLLKENSIGFELAEVKKEIEKL
jgi:hypothetical protein